MSRHILLLVTFILFHFHFRAQVTAVEVAENTLKVAAFGEEIFYYGFAEGDKLIFQFEELKGKELKEIEIIELPSNSRFMDYKSSKIENKILEINKTGIYKFRFSNSGIGARICKFKIQRVPASEATKFFNCSVYWKTVYDSSQKIVPERYLIKKEYKPVQLLDPSYHYINSGRNALFQGGKSRISLPVILPKNTVEWYYTFSASRDEDEINKTKTSYSLMKQVTKLLGASPLLNIGVDMFTRPPGGDVCDVYLLDVNNRVPFEEKLEYRFGPEGSRENLSSGVVKIKSTLRQINYLGIKNPDAGYGIHVVIEAVAITVEEEWGKREVMKFDVIARKEAYLLN